MRKKTLRGFNPPEISTVSTVDFHRVFCPSRGNRNMLLHYLIEIYHPAQDAPSLDHDDVTGGFCTSGSEREFTLEGSWYADEEIQAGTDRDVVAAG
jgi:hypothetical protein